MKILGVRLARSVWFMPSHFLNPKGINVRPIIESIKSRYQFETTPIDSKPNAQSTQGINFERGIFKTKKNEIQIVSLNIYDDGIVINTRSSTEYADSFMEDLIEWGNKEFGLPKLSELPVRRAYVSEINIAFDKNPKIISPRLSAFLNNVSAAMGDKVKGDVDFFGLNLGLDQLRSKEPIVFKIDREINTANHENRFWCSAPIQTGPHIELLEELERLAI